MIVTNVFKILTIFCLLFALSVGQVTAVIPEEKPEAFAMVLDIPVRVLGIGILTVGTAFFIVALPFALTSGSTGDAWDALIVDPFKYTFTRPLGKYENWKSLSDEENSSD